MKFSFTIYQGDKSVTVSHKQLAHYAERLGLNYIAKDRYSWLFVMDIYLYEKFNQISPYAVLDEIKTLEKGDYILGTKAATEFKHEPLRGFWHKHFFSARFLPANLSIQLKGKKFKTRFKEILDPRKSPIITPEMINELAYCATTEAYEERSNEKKLTGEWVIFKKYEDKNYYLCLARHNSGDEKIYNRIKLTFQQFPFLAI